MAHALLLTAASVRPSDEVRKLLEEVGKHRPAEVE
jgi:hypothetical protein